MGRLRRDLSSISRRLQESSLVFVVLLVLLSCCVAVLFCFCVAVMLFSCGPVILLCWWADGLLG